MIFSSNLLTNGSGQSGLTGWTSLNVTIKTDVPGRDSVFNFASNGTLSQTVTPLSLPYNPTQFKATLEYKIISGPIRVNTAIPVTIKITIDYTDGTQDVFVAPLDNNVSYPANVLSDGFELVEIICPVSSTKTISTIELFAKAVNNTYAVYMDHFNILQDTGAAGADGLDAYSIMLSSDTVAIPTDAAGNNPVLTEAVTTAIAYLGDTSVTPTIGTLVTSNCTAAVQGGINVAITSISADTGYVDIPVLVDGVTIAVKTYTFAKAKQGITGDPGADGSNAIMGLLTNESCTIPTDSAGNNGIYTNAVTTMKVYEGSTDVTASWSYAATPSAGVTGSLATNTYTVTAMSVDSGYVDITASRSGYANITKRFSLSKNKQGITGNAGQNATAYWLIASAAAIQKNTTGTYTPATITVTGMSQVGTGTPALYAGRFKIAETTDGTTYTDMYTSAANESSKTYTPSAGIKALRLRLYLAGGTTTLLDEQIIPIVSDGATGAQGPEGPQGPQGIQGIQGVAGATGATGISFRARGAWAAGQNYVNDSTYTDVVTYNGSSFYCKVSHTSVAGANNPSNTIPPVENTYWGLVAIQGAQGPIGNTGATGATGVSYRNMGTWVSTTTYVNNSSYIDTVSYNGSLFACIPATNLNNKPADTPVDNAYWKCIVAKGGSVTDMNWVHTNTTSNGQSSIWKNAGVDATWDASAYSLNNFTGGCFLEFKPSQINKLLAIGLNTDPTTNVSYTSIDYAWYLKADGTYTIYENGTDRVVTGSYVAGDTFHILYEGTTVKYYYNGALKRTVTVSAGLKLYIDTAFYNTSTVAQLYDISLQSNVSFLDWVQKWDGLKVDIKGESIISPKIFAGINGGTSSSPILTGIAIGRDVLGGTDSTIGLVGYNANVKTFELKTDGSAVFGTTAGYQFKVNTDGSIETPYMNADRINAGYLSVDRLQASSIGVDKLAIGVGEQGGFFKNPRFTAWAGTYPDGAVAWSVGGISKVLVDNVYIPQFTCPDTQQYGMQLQSSFFPAGINLDGIRYFALEMRFRLTSGTSADGAALLVDIYRQDDTSQRLQLNCNDAGATLTTNTWYTVRKIFEITDVNIAKMYKSVSGYLLANWGSAGPLTIKTIQFASINMYAATRQDYLTQTWTFAGATTINGGVIQTASLSANAIFGGTLALGGSTYGNGLQKIYDASNNLILQFDTDGIKGYKDGVIKLSKDVFIPDTGNGVHYETQLKTTGLTFTYTTIGAGGFGQGHAYLDTGSLQLAQKRTDGAVYQTLLITNEADFFGTSLNGRTAFWMADGFSINMGNYDDPLYDQQNTVLAYNPAGFFFYDLINISQSGDGATLLTFTTERPWSFKQSGTGAAAALNLESVNSDKTFKVTCVGQTTPAFEVVASTTAGAQVAKVDGSLILTAGNTTYDIRDSWLRENGNDSYFKVYGNSRSMLFRTDGTTAYSDNGAYPFVWLYGGETSAYRRMILSAGGSIWTSNYGWLDEKFWPINTTYAGDINIDASAAERHVRAHTTGADWGFYFASGGFGAYDWTNGRTVFSYTAASNTLNLGSGTVNISGSAAVNMADFVSSLGTSGYQKFPSGLIMQWGVAANIVTSTVTTVTLPLAFPTGIYSSTGSINGGALGTDMKVSGVEVNLLSASQIQVLHAHGANRNISWIAFGH